MNERINELRLDAGISRLHDEPYLVAVTKAGEIEDPIVGLKKFAELIVRECCEQFAKHPYVGTRRTQYIYGYIQGRIDAEQQIKQHFGVEE